MFDPLYENFVPKEKRAAFRDHLDDLLQREFRYAVARLHAAGIGINVLVDAEIDLMWLPPPGGEGFPIPVISEAILGQPHYKLW